MDTSDRLKKIYSLLLKKFDPQHWWPGETPFEVMIGAVLTQNTSWGNVEKAIANIKRANLLDPKKLLNLSPGHLAELIRPAGYFNVKAKRLRNFLKYFVDEYEGAPSEMEKQGLPKLREELLGVNGIGRETADSILLYALNKPVFVCDTYTYRILSRHGLVPESADYDEIQSTFMDNLCEDVSLFNEYHALIVRTGKEFCRPKPRCENCPLKKDL